MVPRSGKVFVHATVGSFAGAEVRETRRLPPRIVGYHLAGVARRNT
jgi:hypothetical protein